MFLNHRMAKKPASLLCLFLVLLLILPSFSPLGPAAVHAAEPEENPRTWVKNWGTGLEERVESIAADASGNVYLITRSDKQDTFIVKYNAEGENEWANPLGSEELSNYAAAVDSEGNVFVARGKYGVSPKLFKYNSSGARLWTQDLDSSLGSWPSLSADSAGNIYLAGSSQVSDSYDVFLVKYDKNGLYQWIRQISSIPRTVDDYTLHWDRAVKVSTAAKDIVYVIGETNGTFEGNVFSGGSSDYFLAKFNAAGEKQLIVQDGLGSNNLSWPAGLSTDGKGNAYALVGAYYSWWSAPPDYYYLIKYTPGGAVAWSRQLPKPLQRTPGSVTDEYGYTYIYGNYVDSFGDRDELLLVKYDPTGNLLWTKELGIKAGNSAGPFGRGIAIGDGGSTYLTVESGGTFFGVDSDGDSDAFLAKFNGDYTDTDGDGLTDKWEKEGYRSGDIFIDLPGMGADPEKKDIFVEVDWMTGFEPKPGALSIVREAFSRAPVGNPDGSTGINIHIDAGPDSIMNPVTGETWGDRSRADILPMQPTIGMLVDDNYIWNEFQAIKDVKFNKERAAIFHYALFANQLGNLGTTSGISRGIGASDFIVSLGGWAQTEMQQAGTFMHELGHNLALLHGGQDEDVYKPNYLSIMNYSFQTRGLIANGREGVFDYSRFSDIRELDEGSLSETQGLSSVSGDPVLDAYGTFYYAGGVKKKSLIKAPIDWNGNGEIDEGPVSSNINSGPPSGHDPTISKLKSYDDWSKLIYTGGVIGLGSTIHELPTATPVIRELDHETDQALGAGMDSYQVSVTASADLTLKPGASADITFTVTNLGTSADEYTLTASSPKGWANLGSVPGTLSLAAGESSSIVIPVQIPTVTAPGSEDSLNLSAVSSTEPLNRDSDRAYVGVKPSITQTAVQITDSGNWPAIHGNKIAYTKLSNTGSPVGINVYDISTGEDRRIHTLMGIEDAGRPAIYGNRIVWRGSIWSSSQGKYLHDIYMYDLETDTKQQMTNHGVVWTVLGDNRIFPDIYDNTVVYKTDQYTTPEGVLLYQTIHVIDLTTGTEKLIPSQSGDNSPQIFGDKITWYNYGATNQNIYLYDLSTQTKTTVTTARLVGAGNDSLSFDAGKIAWESSVFALGYKFNIFVQDLATGVQRRITNSSSDNHYRPAISGDRVIYRRGDFSTTDRALPGDLYVYDLSTSTERRITPISGFYDRPAIFGSRAVWQDNKDSKHYLYYLELDPPKMTPTTTLTTSSASHDVGEWFTSRPEITLSADWNDAITYYQWNGTTELGWRTYAVPLDAPEGEQTLYYYSTDRFGNKEVIQSRTFKVDTAAPVTTLTSNPSEPDGGIGWYRTIPEITLSVNEPGTNFYQWDGDNPDGWIPYTAPIRALEGEHTLYYRSADLRGNYEAVNSQTFLVDSGIGADSTAPATLLSTDSGAPDEGRVFTEAPVISLSTNEDSVIYVQWDSIEDSGMRYPMVASEAYGTGMLPTELPGWKIYWGPFKAPEGVHTLNYYAVDRSGNAEEVKSTVFNVNPDAQKIQVTITSPEELEDVEGSLQVEGSISGAPTEVFIRVDEQTPVQLTLPAELKFSHTLDTSRLAPGVHSLTITAKDNSGNEGQSSVTFNVLPDTEPPDTVIETHPSGNSTETEVQFTFMGTDNRTPTSDIHYLHKLTGVDEDYVMGSDLNVKYTNLSYGTYTFSVKAVDWAGNIDPTEATWTFTVGFIPQPPVVQIPEADVPGIPVAVNTLVYAKGIFTDPDNPDSHTADWSWGDGSASAGGVLNGTVTGTHIYNTPGVYPLRLKVTDQYGLKGEDLYQYIVVYDPSAGFVTGGGWINSPEGAYVKDSSLTGKANFGFVAKYQKGATVPTGQTQFQFQLGGLKFHSTSYDWLVVSGARAQYKGSGDINGQGDYNFMLTAVDGDILGGGASDKFRIKIWVKSEDETVIYDNLLGNQDDTESISILNGKIEIHR